MIAPHRDQFVGTVTGNEPLCRDHFRLTIRLAEFPTTRPGQFVQVSCRDADFDFSEQRELDWDSTGRLSLSGAELSDPLAYLRRPFSLAGRKDLRDAVELSIIQRVVGVGTDWLSHVRIGQHIDVLGPLGNGFELPGPDEIAILVGGGVGIPPMIYLASTLVGRKAVVFCGATTRDLLPLTVTADAPAPGPVSIDPLYNIDEFSRYGVPAIISTDDGSYGFKGFTTQALTAYLDQFIAPTNARCVFYTCGPEIMMKRVGEIAISRGYECQVAVERAMACGMGTCQSCCIRIRKPDAAKPPLVGKDWCWRLACTDGPVFRAKDILW